LFAATVFASAALLFLVEPMIAKMALPQLGGTPAVWNTCMVFFQAALLAGYALADRMSARLTFRAQTIILALLLLCALVVLPVDLEQSGRLLAWLGHLRIDLERWALSPQSAAENPIPWLLGHLLVAIGLPFVALSIMGPLMQRWFAVTERAVTTDPYALYAASNLGSMLALIAYPSLVEPLFTLGQQSWMWSCGYMLFLLLTLGCAVQVWRAAKQSPAKKAHRLRTPPPIAAGPIAARRRLRWIVLAFVPSSLMLGATTYLSTDIATIPLLWILPLSLYLLTFILVFGPRQLVPHAWMGRLLPGLTLLLVTLILLHDMQPPAWLVILLNLLTLFVAAMFCHGELALDRPPPSQLTEFYLWLGVGGVLGGLFNALLAPLIFPWVVEYPLGLLFACLLRWRSSIDPRQPGSRLLDAALPVGLGVLTVAGIWTLQAYSIEPPQLRVGLMFGLPAVLCYTLIDRPVRFTLGLGALIVASFFYVGSEGRPIYTGRSFFGVLRVTTDAQERFHQIVHGNTVHGRQSLDPRLRREPLSYYSRTGPIGQLFTAMQDKLADAHIGLIGLGAGSLASYAQPGQTWTYYEIDPLVERVARDRRFFTFLEDCRARKLEVVLGDGRLRMRDVPDGQYQLIVLDAFNSDAVPVHLLTREALHLYRSKLAKGAILAFHISNRYLDLRPVLAALARDANLTFRYRDDLELIEEEREQGKEPSQWAVMVESPEYLGALAVDPRWRRPEDLPGIRVWTDHFSNLLEIFVWH
jgi:hypothetical protein